ncbi:MAG: hypothetical protein ACRD1N_04855 [Terriglobia bacterium]
MSKALQKIANGIAHPLRAAQLVYGNTYLWNHNYNNLRRPKARGAVPQHSSAVHEEVIRQLREEQYDVREYKIDIQDFRRYLAQANYAQFPRYYRGGKAVNFFEKSLEHYLAATFLGFRPGEVYIDVANDSSPTPEIYAALYGCTAYRQDLTFPEGVHGKRIGGDAARMPLPAGFAAKMALHCSFEHFEGDSDIRFITEANRLLKEGGRLCILPLYLHTEYSIQTDPAVHSQSGIPFEPDAVLYCARWYGNRHGRIYSVAKLTSRIRAALGSLRLAIYVIQNGKEIAPSCYLKFVAVFERPSNL